MINYNQLPKLDESILGAYNARTRWALANQENVLALHLHFNMTTGRQREMSKVVDRLGCRS